MTWAKIDEAILDNPKIAKAGVFGFAMHIAAIAWSCRNLTDGFIPLAASRRLLDLAEVSEELVSLMRAPSGHAERVLESLYDTGRVEADAIAATLVGVGLWESAQGGYLIHDFLVYNPSREKVLKERAQTAERVNRYRASRAGNGVTYGDTNGVSNAKCNGKGNAVSNTAPDPDPDPGSDPKAVERLAKDLTGSPRVLDTTDPPSGLMKASERPEFRAFEASFQRPPQSIEAWAGPDSEHSEQARRAGLDLAWEVEDFRDHARSKGIMSCDFSAEFKRWLKRSAKFKKRDDARAGPPAGKPPGLEIHEATKPARSLIRPSKPRESVDPTEAMQLAGGALNALASSIGKAMP